MLYRVTRTSTQDTYAYPVDEDVDYSLLIPPVEGATFDKKRSEVEYERVWTIEINDILDFVRQCGSSVVVSLDATEDGLPGVEIYDDYRE